jgi:hypothetical protein
VFTLNNSKTTRGGEAVCYNNNTTTRGRNRTLGNSISRQQLVPCSLLECVDNDMNFDIDLFSLYRRKQHATRSEVWEQKLAECLELAEAEMEAEGQDRKTRRRRMKTNSLRCRNDQGELTPLTPKMSTWWSLEQEVSFEVSQTLQVPV